MKLGQKRKKCPDDPWTQASTLYLTSNKLRKKQMDSSDTYGN